MFFYFHIIITPLDSVGSGIDLATGMVYPMMLDGTFCTDEGVSVHFNNCEQEWKDRLSDEDKKITLNILPF